MAILKHQKQLSRGTSLVLNDGFLAALKNVLVSPAFTFRVGSFVVLADIILCMLIIRIVSYTEIDWSTYMEQIDKFLNGTRDYEQIYGSTGPLVYPAGHLYIFTILRFLSSDGKDVFLAQHLFLVIYAVNCFLVLAIYNELQKVPPYALILMFLSSYRVHSIFLLRLFNDPVAVTMFHSSLLCFIRKKWIIGCILYSAAVSVKMNILLFAPGLLLVLLENLSIMQTTRALTCCALVQLAIGLPFLAHSPLSYFRGAFDLSRVFLHKWTVNWRFVPEPWFTSRPFHLALLIGHVVALFAIHRERWAHAIRNLFLIERTNSLVATKSFPSRVVLTLFSVNLVGMIFSRSLHYQFYVWYFYSIPALLWSTSIWIPLRLLMMLLLELCWNTYPSTNLSSLMLLLLHFSLLAGVYKERGNIQKEEEEGREEARKFS